MIDEVIALLVQHDEAAAVEREHEVGVVSDGLVALLTALGDDLGPDLVARQHGKSLLIWSNSERQHPVNTEQIRQALQFTQTESERVALANLIAAGILLRESGYKDAGWKAIDSALRALRLPDRDIDAWASGGADDSLQTAVVGFASVNLIAPVRTGDAS